MGHLKTLLREARKFDFKLEFAFGK